MPATPPPQVTSDLLAPLRKSLTPAAQVLLPSDPTFPATIESWNFDFRSAHPTAAILPTTTADVAAAIKFLRHHNLPFTVGCGLHSRYSKRSGHVLLYLGLMRAVTIDLAAKVARVQGGARNEDLDRAGGACVPPLHVVAGTNPDTGVGGLILGGGVGYLSRRQGMSIDNLLEVELVTAEGEVVRANETQHTDLFWAVRGAGYNFGVVTEFVMRVYDDVGHQLRPLSDDDEATATKYGLPVQEEMKSRVLQGMLPYPLPQFENITKVLQSQYIEAGSSGPFGDRDLFLGVALANTPMGPLCMVLFAYVGDAYRGYRAADKLIDAIGAPLAPVAAALKLDTYVQLQHMLDAVTPPGHYYERTFMAAGLGDDLSAALRQSFDLLSQFPGMGHSAVTGLILGVQGGIQQNSGKGAFSTEQRKGNVLVGMVGHFDPEEAAKAGRDGRAGAVEWANKSRDLILPHVLTVYTNSVSGHAGMKVTYAGSVDRLRQVKQQYDPHNVFCNNQNIVPASQEETASETAQPDYTS